MFETYVDKKGEYRFRLKAKNGQIILASEGYSQKSGCANGIESVKKNAQDDSKFDLKQSSNGQWHFNLKAGNGEIIGTSEMYSSEATAKNGIQSVMNNAPSANVVHIE